MNKARTITASALGVSVSWCLPAFLVCLGLAPATQPPPVAARDDVEVVRADLVLLTGGRVHGPVLDHTDHGLVVVADKTPHVFAWDELESGSAYRIKRALLTQVRGGEEKLTADDHFSLGGYMLSRDRAVIAVNEFNQAKRLDRSYGAKVNEALDQYRNERAARRAAATVRAGLSPTRIGDTVHPAAPMDETAALSDELTGVASDPRVGRAPLVGDATQLVAKIKAFYAQRLPEGVGPGLELIETDHFLLWSDLPRPDRVQLAKWCEAMYEALCVQFGFPPTGNVFLGKCPVFCFRSKARFQNFARRFDGHSGKGSVGYTRSVEQSGYVHVVLFKQGATEPDLNRFASTLVHEACHALLHRFHRPRLIPHWVNEGYADLVAERILQDRCVAGENAELLARQYVRYNWPISGLLDSAGPIGVHQYALAHSVVSFLESVDADGFAAFVRGLKEGMTIADALAAAYDGMTLETLEVRWRASIHAECATGGGTTHEPLSGGR